MTPKLIDKTITIYSWICGLGLLLSVSVVMGYLIYQGASTLSLSLIFGEADPVKAILFRQRVLNGLFPAILGTMFLVVLSVGIALPIGLSAGIYMAEYAHGRLRYFFDFIMDILAGIPSIVVGLFGFSGAIFLHHYFSEKVFPCLLISAASLAFLIMPYLIRCTQTALQEIPSGIRQTGLALGATKFQNIRYILLPHGLPGIVGGIVLSIGRCAEDTAVIMLTGVVASAGIPRSLLSSYEALPFYIFYISSQYGNRQELLSGYGASILLLGICCCLFLIAYFIRNRLDKQFRFAV